MGVIAFVFFYVNLTSMIFFKVKHSYTTEKLALERALTGTKICYRPDLKFLSLRLTLGNSLSNRIAIRSGFKRSYKDLKFYYNSLLRANFLYNTPTKLVPFFLKNFDNKDFLLAYSQYQSMKDIDYALLWRASQTNALFDLHSKRVKKKKKISYINRVYFIPAHKRLLFVWKWLSVIARCNAVKHAMRRYSLIPTFENFLMASRDRQILNDFKVRVYRVQLLRAM